jgi:hypothetical protein
MFYSGFGEFLRTHYWPNEDRIAFTRRLSSLFVEVTFVGDGGRVTASIGLAHIRDIKRERQDQARLLLGYVGPVESSVRKHLQLREPQGEVLARCKSLIERSYAGPTVLRRPAAITVTQLSDGSPIQVGLGSIIMIEDAAGRKTVRAGELETVPTLVTLLWDPETRSMPYETCRIGEPYTDVLQRIRRCQLPGG